jgi:UDP-N-acetylglucosamine:LPS N-acetylglucosamine transferase
MAISKSALPAILISPAGIAAGELSAQAKDFIASGACLGKKEEELTALELARMVATLGMDSARLREMRHRMETARRGDGVASPQR